MTLCTQICNRYGSRRGLLAYLCHQITWRLEPTWVRPGQLKKPDRLVFVCLGNICRSPLGAAVARQLGADAVSFGLETRDDAPANTSMLAMAHRLGIDLSTHRTTPISRYRMSPNDLVVLMQPTHLPALRRALPNLATPVTLLGLWAPRPRAYIHDPYGCDAAYFESCARLIRDATTRLMADVQLPSQQPPRHE